MNVQSRSTMAKPAGEIILVALVGLTLGAGLVKAVSTPRGRTVAKSIFSYLRPIAIVFLTELLQQGASRLEKSFRGQGDSKGANVRKMQQASGLH